MTIYCRIGDDVMTKLNVKTIFESNGKSLEEIILQILKNKIG